MPTVLDRRPARPGASRLYHFDPLLGETSRAAGTFRRKLLVASGFAHLVGFVVLSILPSPARSITEPSLPVEIVLTAALPTVPEFIPPAPAPRAAPKPQPPPTVRERAPEPVPAPEPPAPAPPPPVQARVEPQPAPKPAHVVRTNVFGGVAVGPPVVTGKTGRTVIAAFGDEVAPPNGAPARRGRVAEVGFDTAPASGSPRRVVTGTVQKGGFDATAEAPVAPPKRERPAVRLDSEVEILSKARPVYTEEARRLRIEGDIVLKVTFEASGRLVVLGVLEGLGHGLDEAAIAAAKKIEFTPARREGQPVDHTATLRVVFRLA